MANKWMNKYLKMDGVIKWDYDPYSDVLRTGSPSFDYIYGKTHGLPRGYSEILWGPPKGGKSLSVYMKIGELHKSDPEAIAMLISTEMRGQLQLTPLLMRQYGIDPDRLIVRETNLPEEVFDLITNEVQTDIQKHGMPLKYLAIDSITNIIGRRTLNAESVSQQQIGDAALTLQDGLQKVVRVIRRCKIGMSMVAQARAELDQLEQKRGNKLKLAGGWYLKHFGEYFIFVEHNRNKEARTDLLGNKLEDESKLDVEGDSEETGHKIRVTMKGNSTGVAGRVGQFTMDYYQGIQNIYEEAFLLGKGQGVIQRPNQTTYLLPDWPTTGESTTFRGKEETITALKDNDVLRAEVLKRVRMIDIQAMKEGRVAKSGLRESALDEQNSEVDLDVPQE